MPFTLPCPNCQAKLNVEEKLRGRKVICPKCQTKLTIPGGAETIAQTPIVALKSAAIKNAPAKFSQPSALPPISPTAPAVAKGNGISPQIIVIAGGGLAAMLLVVGFIAFLAWPGGNKTAAQPIAAVPVTPVPRPPATNIPASPKPATPLAPAQSPAVDTSKWVPLPGNPTGIQLKFPVKPAPFDLMEGQTGTDKEFGQAVLESAKPTALRAAVGGRTFSLTIMPLELNGMPVEVYLDRTFANIELLNPGYKKISEFRSPEAAAIARDALLRSDAKTRVLRIAHDGTQAIGVMIDGSLTLTYEDAQAQAFLGCLRIANRPIPAMQLAGAAVPVVPAEAPPPVITPVEPFLKNPLLLPQQVSPLTNDWQIVRGNKIPFQVKMPGTKVTRGEPASLFDKSKQLEFLTSAWKDFKIVKSEIFYLNQGTRRFTVVVVEMPTKDLLWFDVLGNANAATESARQFFTTPGDTWTFLDQGETGKWSRWTTLIQKQDSAQQPVAGTRIVHQRSAGQYGFLLILESEEKLDWNTAEMQFFKDLQFPADTMKFE